MAFRPGVHSSGYPTVTGSIPQDNIIFGMVLLAFVIYITVRGELQTYMGFFSPVGSGTAGGTKAVPAVTLTPTTPSVANQVTGIPPAPTGGIIPGTLLPGTPGLSLNPFSGLPPIVDTVPGGT